MNLTNQMAECVQSTCTTQTESTGMAATEEYCTLCDNQLLQERAELPVQRHQGMNVY